MRKAVEIQLSRDTTVVVTEPKARDMGAFFRALPVLSKLESLKGADESNPIKGLPAIDITDEDMDKILDLLGRIVTGLPEGQTVSDLSMFEALRLFEAFKLVIPEGFEDFTAPAAAG